jgi:hypothetical protein
MDGNEKFKKCDRIARASEIYPSTKGVMSTYDIIIVLSRHVESIILMTYCGFDKE